MKATRRAFNTILAAAAFGALGTAGAFAQDSYPSKPVTVIVPYDPGGPVEIMGRIVLDKLSQRLGQQFVIETKPGAATAIGTEHVVRAKPDGYTLLYTSISALVTLELTKKDELKFDIVDDLAPVVSTHTGAYVLYANPTLGFKSTADLIAAAKAKPGELTYSSTGIGAHTYFTTELFKHLAGLDILHIPYKGTGPATQAAVTNEVSMIFGSPVLHKQYGETGMLTALGVTSEKPIPQIPNVRAIADTVPGFKSIYAFTMFAPKDTPKEIVDKLNTEIAAVLELPDVREKILAVGEPGGASAADVAADMALEVKTLNDLVATVGLKLQ